MLDAQLAEPDFSGKTAVIKAGEFDKDGRQTIQFSKAVITELKNSKKELRIEMPGIDMTLAANNLQQLAKLAGQGYNLHLSLDDDASVDNSPTLAPQLHIAATDNTQRTISLNFKAFTTLAFKTDSRIKAQYGAQADEKGRWKIIQGNLAGDVFTLKVKQFGNYTVVTNKRQTDRKSYK